MLIFGTKAHLINTHLLGPRSKSSAKVKVEYQGYISKKIAVSGALVFHKHILFLFQLHKIIHLPYLYTSILILCL